MRLIGEGMETIFGDTEVAVVDEQTTVFEPGEWVQVKSGHEGMVILTPRKSYKVIGCKNDRVTVLGDIGLPVEYFAHRFERSQPLDEVIDDIMAECRRNDTTPSGAGVLGALLSENDRLVQERDGAREALAVATNALLVERENLRRDNEILRERIDMMGDDNERAWERAGGLALEVQRLSADCARLRALVSAYVAQGRELSGHGAPASDLSGLAAREHGGQKSGVEACRSCGIEHYAIRSGRLVIVANGLCGLCKGKGAKPNPDALAHMFGKMPD